MIGMRVQVLGDEKVVVDLARISGGMAAGFQAELARTTKEAHDSIVSSTDDPYLTGFTRRSTGHDIGKAIYSTLPWARIWEYGGVVEPSGHAISFPRTEWMSKPMNEAFEGIEDRLAKMFDTLAGIGHII